MLTTNIHRLHPIMVAALLALTALPGASRALAAYDPLALPDTTKVNTIEFTVHDAERARDIPLYVYLPGEKSPAPVILFSHGLGGTNRGSGYLGEHWAARGYAAVFVQHPGSDDSVWRDVPRRERMTAMRQAASGERFMLRVQDIPAVLDQLETWNREKDHQLNNRLDLEHVGMSGHSFGALTTQAVSGQTHGNRPLFTDPRIDAALPMSPSIPRQGTSPEAAFGSVHLPWLLMTGTKDTAVIGDQTVETRLMVYPALPPGSKYELVLHDAEHSAFTERSLPMDRLPRNPNHHRVILALSTAFWDAYLRGDAEARAWLDGEGPRGVMEPEDRWQRK